MSPSEIPLLFAELPDAFASLFNPAAPWELLGDPLDEILASLPSSEIHGQLAPDVHLVGDRIVICPGARIHPTAVIEGPIYIGRDVEIRPGAYLRGGIWIGDRCIVGANTEIKRAILLPHAKAPHLNYVGDSILGFKAHLGAGAILSNVRLDRGEITVVTDSGLIPTGLKKFGAILGDRVEIGCNSVLNPGSLIGRDSIIYPGMQWRGVCPANSIAKARTAFEIVPRRAPGAGR